MESENSLLVLVCVFAMLLMVIETVKYSKARTPMHAKEPVEDSLHLDGVLKAEQKDLEDFNSISGVYQKFALRYSTRVRTLCLKSPAVKGIQNMVNEALGYMVVRSANCLSVDRHPTRFFDTLLSGFLLITFSM